MFIEQNNFNDNNNNQNNLINNPINKLNSKTATDYLKSLHDKLHILEEENDELKKNIFQLNEDINKEKLNNFNEKKALQNQILILNNNLEMIEKEKQKHISQNIIVKENYEGILENIKNENKKINKRLKELINENERLKTENFNLSNKIFEFSKISYENIQLKEKIKNLFKIDVKKTIKNIKVKNNNINTILNKKEEKRSKSPLIENDKFYNSFINKINKKDNKKENKKKENINEINNKVNNINFDKKIINKKNKTNKKHSSDCLYDNSDILKTSTDIVSNNNNILINKILNDDNIDYINKIKNEINLNDDKNEKKIFNKQLTIDNKLNNENKKYFEEFKKFSKLLSN